MVSRLVQKQEVRFTCQRATDGGATFFTTACGFRLTFQINAQLVGNRPHRIFGRTFYTMNGKIDEPVKGADVGILFEHHDVRARHDDAIALVCFDGSGHQLHQRRFASSIAADQRQPVARADKQINILKQPATALLEREIFEGEDWMLRHMGWRIGGRKGRGKPDCRSVVFCHACFSGHDDVDVDAE